MKKLILPFLVMAVLMMASCSEKFNVAAPYKNITVVYALLDRIDTAHYVRIQKAFLDQDKSAVTMAQNADSNFFPNINVMIKRLTFTGTLHDTIHLNRVDLAQEGFTKEPGAFFTSPNYAYKFTNDLDPLYVYRIMVTNPATGEIDSSDAPIIDDKNVSAFNVDIVDDSNLIKAGLDFASTLPNQSIQFTGSYYALPNFNDLHGRPSPTYLAQAIFRFHWVDSNQQNGTKTPHYYDFNAGYQLMYNTASISQSNYKIDDITFYSALSTGMGAAPTNIARLMARAEVFFYVSTADYYNYYQNSLTQGTGLTGNEIEPIFTNVKGKNALGLFTSRGMRSGFAKITLNTIDSMILNPMFSKAHIVGTEY